jgi:hypothetical protein
MKLLLRVLPLAIALLVPSMAFAEDAGHGAAASKPAAAKTHAGRTAKRAKASTAKPKKAVKAKAPKAPKAAKKAPKAAKKAAK